MVIVHFGDFGLGLKLFVFTCGLRWLCGWTLVVLINSVGVY